MKDPTFAPIYAGMYKNLARIAREHGYALAVHGTLTSDLDLIACPWIEDAKSPEELKEAFAKYLGLFKDIWGTGIDGGEIGDKPHGRIAWKLQLPAGAAVDLSVMPKLPAQRP